MGDESSSVQLTGLEKILNVRDLVGPFIKLLVRTWKGWKKISMWLDNWHPKSFL